MTDIQSNYPRDDTASWLGPELNRLEKLTNFDTIVACFYALSVITFAIISRLVGESTFRPFLIPIAQLNGALFLTIVIVTVRWIYLAHFVVCQLRKHRSHFSSLKTAFLCLISPLLMFLPMTRTLDFLVQLSCDEHAPTMRWFSLKSGSNLVTAFLALGVVEFVVSVVQITISGSPQYRTVSLIGGVINVAMILIGNRIVVRITQNLSGHVSAQRG